MAQKTPDTSLATLVDGFITTEAGHTCLFCRESTRRGHIYPCADGSLVDAEQAMRDHIEASHRSVFHALLEFGKKGTGLSDIQRSLLGYLYDGLSDKEIQPLAGGVSLSTIRNHRFVLREKARQARVLLALMELLDKRDLDPGQRFIEIPGTASADDERFAITEVEYRKIIKAHFPEGADGSLTRFPKKEKRKVAVMINLLKRFDAGKRYTQAEVNGILNTASEDHTTLCRFMVDYGFLGRTRDGSEYWVEQ